MGKGAPGCLKKAASASEDSSEAVLESVGSFNGRKWRAGGFRARSASMGIAVGERALWSCRSGLAWT